MGGASVSDAGDVFIPAEGSQEAANVGPEVNASTSTDVPVSDPETSATAASSGSSNQEKNNEDEKNSEEEQQHSKSPSSIGNSTQRQLHIEESGTSPPNGNLQNEQVAAAATDATNTNTATSQYVSLSASPSRDESASTNTSHSSLLKDFLENFLSQETDVETAVMPADSMHIRGDGQVEISQHDDTGNLFALEAGNRSVVDIHHANDEGYVEGDEGRASAASLCVIKGEQDDISVLTEAVLLELPESISDAEDNEWVSFEESGDGEMENKVKSPTSTSAFFGDSNRREDLQRETNDNALCVDLCGIDCFASSTTQRLQAQVQECGGMFSEGVNRVLRAVGLWYQKLVNPSLRSKSSNGDAMKRPAETNKTMEAMEAMEAMERKAMREVQSMLTNNTSADATASVDASENKITDDGNVNAQEKEQQPTTAECIVALELNGETRDDTAAIALQEERSPTDGEERQDGEDNENKPIVSPGLNPAPKAPVGILKKSKYQPKVNPNAAPLESKKKTRRTPKTSNTTPRRTPKSTRQYVDTNKKSFWASKSPKAVPVPSLKRQKGWTSSKNEPSDYAMMI